MQLIFWKVMRASLSPVAVLLLCSKSVSYIRWYIVLCSLLGKKGLVSFTIFSFEATIVTVIKKKKVGMELFTSNSTVYCKSIGPIHLISELCENEKHDYLYREILLMVEFIKYLLNVRHR
jgi:hypothetical protein